MFTFVGGRPSLDLTATVMYRHRDAPIELLARPADVDGWARAAGLVDTAIDVPPDGLAAMRALRETIYALVRARRDGRPLPAPELAALNAAAARPPLTLRLASGELRRFGGLDQLRSSLARDALELLGGPLLGRVKECAGDDCTRLYLDTSRNANRRWCGMRQCGDKVKAANYRARRRRAGADR